MMRKTFVCSGCDIFCEASYVGSDVQKPGVCFFMKHSHDWHIKKEENMANSHIEKPPLGLMPRNIHERKRAADILDAMQRYSEVGKSIPVEWVDELKGLNALQFE